jgi:hypothetical protein
MLQTADASEGNHICNGPCVLCKGALELEVALQIIGQQTYIHPGPNSPRIQFPHPPLPLVADTSYQAMTDLVRVKSVK